MLFQAVNSPSEINATEYCHAVFVNDSTVSIEKIKTMLAAAILRYLGGLTSIQFVLQLHAAIHNETDLSIYKAGLEVHMLFTQVEHEASLSDCRKEVIDTKLRKILEILTA